MTALEIAIVAVACRLARQAGVTLPEPVTDGLLLALSRQPGDEPAAAQAQERILEHCRSLGPWRVAIVIPLAVCDVAHAALDAPAHRLERTIRACVDVAAETAASAQYTAELRSGPLSASAHERVTHAASRAAEAMRAQLEVT